MNRQALRKRLPDAPGVYFFLGRNKKVLYIGRATSLRSRVQSYFASDIAEKRSSWIGKMLDEARRVEVKKTHSVLEAILLEADLIKKFKPPYNTELKDDKSFNCIAITDEEFPRVLLVRQSSFSGHASRSTDIFLLKNSSCSRQSRSQVSDRHAHSTNFVARYIFGPFPNSAHLKTALKIIRKIFPFRDSCTPAPVYSNVLKNIRTNKPCFNRQLGLCPGVCTGEISEKEYRRHIARLTLFLSGKRVRIQKELEQEMRAAARVQEFEKACELKRQLFALKYIQDVALLKNPPLTPLLYKGGGGGGFWKSNSRTRIEAYDISHFGGKGIVGAMAVVENGVARPSEYRLFKLRSIKTQNEVAGLQEIIRRRLKHKEWPFPQLIIVDGNAVQKKAAEQVLVESGYKIPVLAVVKDERHRPREKLSPAILLANSEAHRFALRLQKSQRK